MRTMVFRSWADSRGDPTAFSQPISFGGGPKCWVTTPTGGPEGCGFRIVVTALFPKG